MSSTAKRSRLLQLAVLLVVVCALAGGVLLIVRGAQSHEPQAAPLPSNTFEVPPDQLPPVSLPPLNPAVPPTVRGTTPAGCALPVAPAHVVIGSLCMSGPIVSTETTNGGVLVIPPDVQRIGLWNNGAQIADPTGALLTEGTTLLAGHVNDFDQGNGTFYDLYKVEPGAIVYVSDAAGHVSRWRVAGLSVVVKAALPKWVYAGPTGPRKLALVTCGGPIEHVPGGGNTYRDNVIVTAVPV